MKTQDQDDYWKIFTHNVKWLRHHYSLSKREMAQIRGISRNTLNRLERGEDLSHISVLVLIRLINYFGVTKLTETKLK